MMVTIQDAPAAPPVLALDDGGVDEPGDDIVDEGSGSSDDTAEPGSVREKSHTTALIVIAAVLSILVLTIDIVTVGHVAFVTCFSRV